jgi:hypothetical protein
MMHIFEPSLNFGCTLTAQSPHAHGLSISCGKFSPLPSVASQCVQEVPHHLQKWALHPTSYKLLASGVMDMGISSHYFNIFSISISIFYFPFH